VFADDLMTSKSQHFLPTRHYDP